MKIGELTERITLQRPVHVRGGAGGIVASWSTVAAVWSNVRAHRGGERYLSAAVQKWATADYEVRIRYRADVDAGMRVLWGDLELDVLFAADPTGRGAELRILCRAPS